MDHGSAHGMGGMDMGSRVPGLFYMAKMYWVIVGAAVAFATCINVLNKVLAYQRYLLTVDSRESFDRLAPLIWCQHSH